VKLLARAPGKVNLGLFVGPRRADGRHELVTVFESVSLADEVTVAPVDGPSDEVICSEVDGPNIVSTALAGLRANGWNGPPVRVTIEKRIPVAGGMGGGSADAGATLRIAPALAPVPSSVIYRVAASLGADVPSQVAPGAAIGTGAGEVLERFPEPLVPHAFVIVPQAFALSTADVYREFDRMGLARSADQLSALLHEIRRRGATLEPALLGNDLERAAVSLRPEIADVLDAVLHAGATHSMVSGSGPTVLGLCVGPEAGAIAEDAADALVDRYPGAAPAVPVREEFWAPRGS
jgi:4-diphosphocytidyl-2-C-methyl-D-erythritol kinase